jgi:hypothetical protein
MLDQVEYERLCVECDRILLREGTSDLAVMATSWLHVVNEHPTNTRKYTGAYPGVFLTLVKFVAAKLVNIARAAARRNRNGVPEHRSEGRAEVLIFSHLINVGHLKQEDDFYFGRLPQYLVSASISTQTAMLNHLGSAASEFLVNSPTNAIRRVMLGAVTAPREEFAIARDQWRASLTLWRALANTRFKTRFGAALDALGGATASNIRFYRQALWLMKRLSPDRVVATFEGHAWERLAFFAARQVNPRVRCIGYQHAVIFPLQHGIRRSLGQQFDPDVVVFAGKPGRDWFRDNANFRPTTSVVGTPRHDSVFYDVRDKIAASRLRPSCLLLPDGTIEECFAILRFGVDCARLMPQVRFVVRLHPIVSLEGLSRIEPKIANLPVNVEISQQTIDADFRDSAWAIYRGSGAGVRAAAVGLRPLYLDDPRLGMRIDPLFGLTSWRRSVTVATDVEAVIREDLAATEEQFYSSYSAAEGYLRSYFAVYDPAGFKDAVLRGGAAG